ncbi:hypothetical protein CEXT_78471 [Caerostris extrusa]|uniref:Uncharacterized protein n=1 Tax=Caerostris extrusa TaxID=172846 RepID=A0AAV4SMB0_CAEEX|nr:hypothetical protein CEXT_78471 [Caerostris extrusa]
MPAFRNTFYASDSHPHFYRNETISQHTISLHFVPVKAICFQREEHPPPSISIIFLLRAEPGFPRFSVLGHGILIRLETRNRTTELPDARACPGGYQGRDL